MLQIPEILIVDDNFSFIDRLKKLLNENGIHNPVKVAHDYNDALSAFLKVKPGIVLLDVNMPGKSGIEVLRYIKAEGWDCKVIMVTNHSREAYRKICLENGAEYFIDKTREFGLIPSLIQKMYD